MAVEGDCGGAVASNGGPAVRWGLATNTHCNQCEVAAGKQNGFRIVQSSGERGEVGCWWLGSSAVGRWEAAAGMRYGGWPTVERLRGWALGEPYE